ncbi:hypothetical protein NLI96_g9400 [Meripilus lineatus]|uniref:Rpa49 subunit specific to nuclear RNA polymerase I n=1 Tax=Meripilus lineatus TaxID=2056292 RepID=A0AAD5YA94_9APHY|nr:hypothetical protein NLI96_g9400 [Physisporinus lineatus]
MASSSQSAASSSKKRKRDTATVPSNEGPSVSIRMASQNSGQIGPVLASFPGIQPPRKTPFNAFLRNRGRAPIVEGEEEDEVDAGDMVITGESETVEFTTSMESREASQGCKYLIGIHDPHTNTTTLVPAPLHILTRQVKSLQNLTQIDTSNPSEERIKLRNTLGETFGTKKAKAAIRAQERNRVDVDAMKGVAGHLQGRIEENTESLPSKEEAKAIADSSRLIPPYDQGAGSPHLVYALEDIVPKAELDSISISPFKAAKTEQERRNLLPFSRSNWISHHLGLVFSAPKVNKKDLQILVYISTMIAFKQASRTIKDKTALQERLKGVPGVVVDGLVSRFTESARESNVAQMTSAMETKLLTYMFALCLRIDDYATDTSVLAKDLQMSTPQVNTLFKSLGCKIVSLGERELKRLGLPDSESSTKRAVLKIPLEFPAVRMKRTKRS